MSENNVETTKSAGKSASVPPQSLKGAQDKPATTPDVGTLDIVIKDPKKLPIADLEFQIIIAGKTVFSGKTDANGNGKTIEGLKIGSIFEVHVKTDKGVFKKVATGTVKSEKCSACLVSSKTRFEVSSEPTKGEQGNAEAHKAQVTEGKKQSADTASATGNEPKPHTVKSERNAKGKPVALVTNGAKVKGGISGKTSGVNKDIVDYVRAVGEYYGANIVATSGFRDNVKQANTMFDRWTYVNRGRDYKPEHLPVKTRKKMDEQYVIAKETPKASEEEIAAAKAKFIELALTATSYHTEGRAIDISRASLPDKAKQALDIELKQVSEDKNKTIWHYQKEQGAVPTVTEAMKAKWPKP